MGCSGGLAKRPVDEFPTSRSPKAPGVGAWSLAIQLRLGLAFAAPWNSFLDYFSHSNIK